MVFCTCERGKQLSALFDTGVKAAQVTHEKYLVEIIKQSVKQAIGNDSDTLEGRLLRHTTSLMVEILEKDIAELSAQSGEENHERN